MKSYAYTFSYKQGTSLIHRLPSWIKILSIPFLSILFFNLNPVVILAFFFFQIALCFYCKITIKEQLKDLRAVLYYALFLLIAKIAGGFFSNAFSDLKNFTSLNEYMFFIRDFFKAEKESGILLLKLLCVMQSASLMFKTSTTLEIRNGLEQIELAVKKIFRKLLFIKKTDEKLSTPVSQVLSIFICFIPQVSRNWHLIKTAWLSRGGKKNLKMLTTLLPVLFTVSMKDAWTLSRAIQIRG